MSRSFWLILHYFQKVAYTEKMPKKVVCLNTKNHDKPFQKKGGMPSHKKIIKNLFIVFELEPILTHILKDILTDRPPINASKFAEKIMISILTILGESFHWSWVQQLTTYIV